MRNPLITGTLLVIGGANMKVEIKRVTNLKKLADKIKNQKNLILHVGFLDAKHAEIATKLEFGGIYPVEQEYKDRALAKGIHLGNTIDIPPRPFMQVTVTEQKDIWKQKLAKLIKKTLDGKQSLNILGEIVKSDIQATMINANSLFQANSLRTQAIKEKDTVLRDTGDLMNSINYEVIDS